jgi:hypothetical protein
MNAEAENHAHRATRMLEIVGRRRPGPRRRKLIREATRERRCASDAIAAARGRYQDP